jgi:hypothetical protein
MGSLRKTSLQLISRSVTNSFIQAQPILAFGFGALEEDAGVSSGN